MKYTALTYSFSYLEPVCCAMSSSNCCFLTCIQISQEAGLLFPTVSEFSTVYCDRTFKGFGIVNKAEIDVFLELSCFFRDPVDVGNLISGSSAFSKNSLNIWNFMVHVFHRLGDIKCIFSSQYFQLRVRLSGYNLTVNQGRLVCIHSFKFYELF